MAAANHRRLWPALIVSVLLVGCKPIAPTPSPTPPPTATSGSSAISPRPTVSDTVSADSVADAVASPTVGGRSTPTGSPTTPVRTTQPPPASAEPTGALGPTATVGPTATGTPTDYIGLRAAGGAVGQVYQLVDLRVGRHEDGFTRIVWELEGADTPPRYEIVERVRAADDPVDGAAVVEVTLTDTYGYEMVDGLSRDTPDSPLVTGVRTLATYDDSRLAWAVGLARPARFEARTLRGPMRLVLDLYHR